MRFIHRRSQPKHSTASEALYGIEREIRGQTAERRREVRQARVKPLLGQLHRWFEQKLETLSAKSDTAAAIRYSLSRWRALTRYVDDGLIEIDNFSAKHALRAVALGRRNYLFAGADSGGERAAAIYSLVGSAKLNGLDSELYLRSVLNHLESLRDTLQMLGSIFAELAQLTTAIRTTLFRWSMCDHFAPKMRVSKPNGGRSINAGGTIVANVGP